MIHIMTYCYIDKRVLLCMYMSLRIPTFDINSSNNVRGVYIILGKWRPVARKIWVKQFDAECTSLALSE